MTVTEMQNQKIISLLESILSELKTANSYAKAESRQSIKESRVRTRVGKKLLTENMADQLVKRIIGG